VEPDYLPDSEVFFSHAWTPFPNGGVWGDFTPGTSVRGSKGAGKNFVAPPLARDSGVVPTKRNFGKNCLVKYCNFIVNLDHSL
jgi:hypothetical protein